MVKLEDRHLFCWLVYVWLQIALFVSSLPRSLTSLHYRMSPDELQQTFGASRREYVPPYQLILLKVFATALPKSNGKTLQHTIIFTAFGRRYILNLVRNKELNTRSKILETFKHSDGDNIIIASSVNTSNLHIGHIFQDVGNGAALLVNTNDRGRFVVSGVVHNIIINHLPTRIENLYSVNYSDHLMQRSDFVYSEYHVVYRQKLIQRDNSVIASDDFSFIRAPPSPYSSPGGPSSKRQKREVHNLYPELLVIVDFGLFKLYNYDVKSVKKYVFNFISAVDLRFRTIVSPQIGLSVAAVAIIKSEDSAPFLINNIEKGNSHVDAMKALAEAGSYLFLENQLPDYDAALILTDRSMCTRNNRWDDCSKITTGYAYVGGGCRVDVFASRVSSLALVEDSGGYSGVIVAAHELGHLLGAVHDGSSAVHYLGGPGAEQCPWTDGYIMSDLRSDYRGLHWSSCSIEQFLHFASSDQSRCMRNYPVSSSFVFSPTLPGKFLSLDTQCKREQGSNACFRDSRVCTQLFCYEKSTGYCVAYRPAVEGSFCGESMHCVDGTCRSHSKR